MPTDRIKAQREIETERFILSTLPALHLPLYKLDGSSILSKDGRGHICEVTGALWTLYGRSFDGTDDYINCGDNVALDITAAITLEGWFKNANLGVTSEPLCRDDGTNRNYALFFDSVTATLGIYCWGTTGVSLHGTTPFGLNAWTHTVGTYDGSFLRIYYNGQLDCTPKASTGAITNANVSLVLGVRAVLLDRDWNGMIGEVRIYSRALSPSEIQRNYLATRWRYQ